MKRFLETKKIIIFVITLVLVVSTFIVMPEKTFAIDTYGRAVGIDVSSHQGTINWDNVKNSGIDFAIIRIGFGWSDDDSQDDRQALRNMSECERLGIPYGVYIYSYATCEYDVNREVDHMAKVIQGFSPPLGVWFDMEDADGYKYRNAFPPEQHGKELTDFCIQFMRGMKAKGYNDVGVYANKNYFTTILDYNAIRSEGMIWLAHWGIPEPSMECEMWQYSSDGEVSGISGRVDMDYIYPESVLMAKIKKQTPDTPTNTELVEGRGDVNNDGKISSMDYVMIKNHIIKSEVLTDEAMKTAADANGDGKISSMDYVIIKNIILSRVK